MRYYKIRSVWLSYLYPEFCRVMSTYFIPSKSTIISSNPTRLHTFCRRDSLPRRVRCSTLCCSCYCCFDWLKEQFELLERCSRRFLNEPRYRQDLRYLRVWTAYVSRCLLTSSRLFRFCTIDVRGLIGCVTFRRIRKRQSEACRYSCPVAGAL